VNDVLAKLNVSEGAEILYGSPGNDVLTGTGKDSTLHGREGNDVLEGGAGSDEPGPRWLLKDRRWRDGDCANQAWREAV